MGYFSITLKGIGWTSVLQGSYRVLTLIKFAIITKLLTPFDLGLYGFVAIILSFFDVVSEFGIQAFLIQTPKDENEYISSAWILSIIRGLVVSLIIILLAVPFSNFFRQQSLQPLIFIAALIPFIKSLENPSIAKFQKHLFFHKDFIYRMIIFITEAVAAVVFTFFYRSSIGLIYSLLLSTVVSTVLSFIVVKPRPKFNIHMESIVEILKFGKWVSLSGVAFYFASQLDSVVIGRILGAQSLGLYQTAQRFSLRPLTESSDVIAKVSFPVFAKLKHDRKRLRKAVIKMLITVTAIWGLSGIVLMFLSKNIITLFLGNTWIAIDTTFKYFSFLGIIASIMAIVTAVFLAEGRQEITAKIMIIRTVVLAFITIPLVTHFGILGGCLASIISFLTTYPYASRKLKDLIN